MSLKDLKDKIEKLWWPPLLPTIRMDRKLFEELVADPEMTNGEGDCSGHTPVRFYDEGALRRAFSASPAEIGRAAFDAAKEVKNKCSCGVIALKDYDDHSITCPQHWALTPDEEREKKNALISEEVCAEQKRQIQKWGEQNHPNLSPAANVSPVVAAQVLDIPNAEQAKARCEQDFSLKQGNWAVVLIEELAEAIEQAALGDDQKLREELIQVAAVSQSWVAALDRKKPRNLTC